MIYNSEFVGAGNVGLRFVVFVRLYDVRKEENDDCQVESVTDNSSGLLFVPPWGEKRQVT